MEKPPAASSTVNKAKKKFLSFIPKAAKAAAILRFEFDHHNITPFSPPAGNNHQNRGNNNHHNHHYYNSGPITSVILEEARKSKSKSSRFDTKEPISPKISCMGQIKIKKIKNKNKNKKDVVNVNKPSVIPWEARKNKKKSSPASRKSDAQLYTGSRAPGLSQMKRFASSRETLSNFDWTNPKNVQKVTPADPVKDRRRYYYYSDEDRNNYSSNDDEDEEEEEEEDDFKIPFSAPLMVGSGGGGGGNGEPSTVSLVPKKEINLWKRRTMAVQPKPLQLNP